MILGNPVLATLDGALLGERMRIELAVRVIVPVLEAVNSGAAQGIALGVFVVSSYANAAKEEVGRVSV